VYDEFNDRLAATASHRRLIETYDARPYNGGLNARPSRPCFLPILNRKGYSLSNAELNPYQSPQAVLAPEIVPGADVWQDGNLLVLRRGSVLPDRCIKCNAPAEGYRLRRNLSWHNPALFLTILAGLLIYVIIALIVRQTMQVEIGLCPVHRSKRLRAIAIGWILALAGIATMILGGTTGGRQSGGYMLIGLGILLIGLFYGLIGSSTVSPKKIDPYFGWLKGACREYLAELPPSPVRSP
jgi:hypothetical protein